MKTGNRVLLDRLAAEYVLGTLRGRARLRFERWLLSPQVGALVKAWEERLAGLEAPIERVAPPSTAWRGIEQRLELRRLARAPAMRWMGIAASLLLFAAVGVFVYLSQPLPDQPRIEHPTAQLPVTRKSLIQQDPQTIYWRVEILGDRQQLAVHVQQIHALEAGQALELWALPEGAPPVSLGLLPLAGEQRRDLSAAQRAALHAATQIAVSLEPSGGSPTGLPTGPVLHVAALQPA